VVHSVRFGLVTTMLARVPGGLLLFLHGGDGTGADARRRRIVAAGYGFSTLMMLIRTPSALTRFPKPRIAMVCGQEADIAASNALPARRRMTREALDLSLAVE